MQELQYFTGLGSSFESEAVPGALPKGRNSPQRPAFGLYAEQLSGSAFTAPRHENRRSWLYRMRPTADHPPFEAYSGASLFAAGAAPGPVAPNRLRWDPPSDLPADGDFIDGLVTMMVNRDPAELTGIAIHLYRASRSMTGRVFVDADGEVHAVRVRAGLTDGQSTVVEGEGLEAGMQAIAAVVGATAAEGNPAPNPFQSQQRPAGPPLF